jgi:hypothetical protein
MTSFLLATYLAGQVGLRCQGRLGTPYYPAHVKLYFHDSLTSLQRRRLTFLLHTFQEHVRSKCRLAVRTFYTNSNETNGNAEKGQISG